MKSLAIFLTVCAALLTQAVLCHAADFDVRKPQFDAEGRFWIYGSGAKGKLPFVPYGFMPEEAAKMVEMNVASKEKPNAEPGERPDESTCISVRINWAQPNWCGVAFISGPDAPQWWAKDARGWHYDLSSLKKKRLVFHARSNGSARIQVKFAILGDQPYGDSLKFPAESRWLSLKSDWQRFELDLSKYRQSDLSRICNGFTFVTNLDSQDGNPAVTTFSLDTIYLE